MRDAKADNRTQVRPLTARALAVVAALGLLFGLIGAGEGLEDYLRVLRNSATRSDASGQIVLIAIDDKAQREVGNWPWNRAVQAQLIDRIDAARPKQVVLDIAYDFPTQPAADHALAAAFERSGKIVLPVQLREGSRSGSGIKRHAIPMFASKTRAATITVFYNYQSAVMRMNYAFEAAGRRFPSFGATLAGAEGAAGTSFPIDYRYRFASIPRYSAGDVLAGRVPAASLRGRSIIIGTESITLGDRYFIPGHGRAGGVYSHIYAGETLLHGRPVDLGWLPAFLAALLIAGCAARLSRGRETLAAFGVATVLMLVAPVATEPRHIFIDITPALFVLLVSAGLLGWRRYKARGFVNTATGLPNLNAIKAVRDANDRALIVARVINYPQLAATLSAVEECTLVDQLVARLSVGMSHAVVFQGDEGIFAWLAEPGIAVGHHVEALHALFRSPARIGKKSYDLAVSFGVEIGSSRSVGNRLSSALVAADEAAAEGLKWKYHDPDRFKDENWRLSLLAQMDEAIDRGEMWVAFQPQLDLATGRIRGAEALARWTHPEKGPISPHEFISAAEQHDRIDRLTLFILDRSISAAAEINRHGQDFDVAVNLSARMLSRRSLLSDVRLLLERHRLDPKRLTLELTETAALANDGSDLDPLIRLCELGVKLSIDDYGTGLSTLDYLKKVPATEIKIDQSFIKSMLDTRSDLVMVKSTIALAHSLGRTVVAEGVENRETLEMLIGLKCDAAQGFMIGRPTSYEGLQRRLTSIRKGRAA